MANKYTTPVPTQEYIPTYRPLPLDTYAQAFSGIQERFDRSKLQDAKIKALNRGFAGAYTNPRLQQAATDVVSRFEQRLAERAEAGDYENMLLETQMDAEELAAIKDQFDTVATNYQEVQDQVLGFEGIADPMKRELLWQQADVNLEYDPNTMSVRMSGRAPELVEEQDYAELAGKAIEGVEGRDAFEYVTLPDGTKQLAISESVSPQRAQALANDAIYSNPKAVASLQQDRRIYTAEAQQVEDPLEIYKSTLTPKEEEQANKEIAKMKATRPNISDAEIYGALKASENVSRAMRFSTNKFAHTNFDLQNASTGTDKTSSSDDLDEYFYDEYQNVRAINNPDIQGVPESAPDDANLGQYGEERDTNAEERLVTRYAGLSPQGFNMGNAPGVKTLSEGEEERLLKGDVDDLINHESIRTAYGDALETIKSQYPQREEESAGEWLERIQPYYEDMRSTESSIFNKMRPIKPLKAAELRKGFFGDKNDPDIGVAASKSYYVTTPGNESGRLLTFEELAEYFGIGTKELANHLSIVGRTDENDVYGKPAYELRVTKDGGWFSSAKTDQIKMIDNTISDTERYRPLIEINDLKHNIKRNSTGEMDINLPSLGGRGKIKAKASPVFIGLDGNEVGPNEHGKYSHRRITLQVMDDKGNVVDEFVEGKDREYGDMLKKIRDRFKN